MHLFFSYSKLDVKYKALFTLYLLHLDSYFKLQNYNTFTSIKQLHTLCVQHLKIKTYAYDCMYFIIGKFTHKNS